MGRYLYQARDGSGALTSGMLDAASMTEAGQTLRAGGKFIVKLAPVNDADPDHDLISLDDRARRVKRREVIFFCHQLAVMVQTGVPLSDALECAAEQSPNDNFRAVLVDVLLQVQAGGELSAAMRKYPRVFPPVVTSLLRASEMSGTMGLMLDQISAYLAKEEQTIRRAKGAMMYPLFMMAMATGVTIFLLTFVLPRFAGVYEQRGAALPAPTQLLLNTSAVLVGYWGWWLAGVVGVVVGGVLAVRTDTGQRAVDWLKLNTPIAGPLFLQLYITRACRTMGTMISAGVSMLDMIAIVRHVNQNAFFMDLWDQVDHRLRQGAQLSEPLFASKLMPRSISQMIYSGERSGQLGKVLARVADFTESEFDDRVEQTTKFIEPLMMAVMGAIIGFVAISLLLPIFSVSAVVTPS